MGTSNCEGDFHPVGEDYLRINLFDQADAAFKRLTERFQFSNDLHARISFRAISGHTIVEGSFTKSRLSDSLELFHFSVGSEKYHISKQSVNSHSESLANLSEQELILRSRTVLSSIMGSEELRIKVESPRDKQHPTRFIFNPYYKYRANPSSK